MTLQHEYVTSIAQQLKYHAAWEPGDPFKLGDYGVLSAGAFKKLGHLREFNIELSHTATSPAFWEFTSTGVRTTVAKDGAAFDSIDALAGIAPLTADATLQIAFAKAYSLYLRAGDSTWEQLSNLRQVAIAARSHPDWDFRWKIVSGRR